MPEGITHSLPYQLETTTEFPKCHPGSSQGPPPTLQLSHNSAIIRQDLEQDGHLGHLEVF